MSFLSRAVLPFNPPSANELTSQSTQEPRPVCTWSAHGLRLGRKRIGLPFPRSSHILTATATTTAAGELFLFGNSLPGFSSSDLYVFSTRNFSSSILQTSGKVPTSRVDDSAHSFTTVALIGNTLLIRGGERNHGNQDVLNNDSLYLLNLGTSGILMSSPTPADHSFARQHRESGLALWSMVPAPMLVSIQPQPWSVPSSSSSAVGFQLTGRPSMICGRSI